MLNEREPSFFTFTSESRSDGTAPSNNQICWQASSIAALGWIPLFTSADDLPGYFRETWNEKLALRALLESGNTMPPESFNGHVGFVEYLKTREFRSAIAIDEPKLYCDRDGTPRMFTFWRGHKVGFTPMPHPLGRSLFDPLPGACDESFTVSFTRDQVTLNYWMGFKLGKLADWAGFAMIGHRAPSAIVNLQLTMRSSGAAFVTFHSSYVPSQHFYVDWQQDGQFNMLDSSDAEFRSFIEAGKCKNAPVARRASVELFARRRFVY